MRTVEELDRLYRETGEDVYLLAKMIRQRLDADRPVLIAISGEQGLGKSTLAIQIGLALMGDELDLNKHFAFTRQEFIERLKNVEKYSVIIADEAVVMHRRRSMRREQIGIVEMLNKIRVYRVCVIFNIPRFEELDKDIKKNVTMHLYITQRGKAWILRPIELPHVEDPWGWMGEAIAERAVKEWWRAKQAGGHAVPDLTAIREHAIAPFTDGVIRFGPVSVSWWKEYLERSEKAKRQIDVGEPLVTIGTAAVLTGLDKEEIARMIRNGDIEFVITPGGQLRIPLSVVRELKEKRPEYVPVKITRKNLDMAALYLLDALGGRKEITALFPAEVGQGLQRFLTATEKYV